ncbi:hypothetical protein SLEP1_g28966 [Rubroshorea leprosula]|uniref:Uncharacterized protein n=1 Tax=Rubroshorea leprosula TaxID=152421 RepID=A0AAV5JVC9_9ROSI|nr:hypothetical protein SLEP1_g28966 [Rubroshorea leprosula]
MAGIKKAMTSGGPSLSPGMYGRRIPMRGKVKAAIVIGIAHSFASIFSLGSRRAAAQLS